MRVATLLRIDSSVMLGWSEIMGSYNTADTMVEPDRERRS